MCSKVAKELSAQKVSNNLSKQELTAQKSLKL